MSASLIGYFCLLGQFEDVKLSDYKGKWLVLFVWLAAALDS